MTKIRRNIDSSPTSRYFFGKPELFRWRSELCSLDNRLKLPINTMRALNDKLSPTDKNILFKYLKSFLVSGRDIEKDLRVTWGISQVINRIEIPNPGDFNEAYSAGSSIRVLVGDPKDYESFFASPKALWAHEEGHTLFEYDKKGSSKWGPYIYSGEGKLERKYFEDIPYNILPRKLLFPDTSNIIIGSPYFRYGLMFYTYELIADKVALQLAGYREARIEIQTMINCRIGTEYPWQRLFLIVLAREYQLSQEEKVLRQGLVKLDWDCRWQSLISTEELLSKMCAFFEQVSLKHQ